MTDIFEPSVQKIYRFCVLLNLPTNECTSRASFFCFAYIYSEWFAKDSESNYLCVDQTMCVCPNRCRLPMKWGSNGTGYICVGGTQIEAQFVLPLILLVFMKTSSDIQW